MIAIVDMAHPYYPRAKEKNAKKGQGTPLRWRNVPEQPLYKKPDWFTGHVVNPLLKGLHRVGIGVAGSQTLAVRGRKSGEVRTNPVNPFELDGRTYLLSPRGTTQWVRNLRAAGGEGELRSGRKVRRFHADEVPDTEKLPLLRLYMDKWSWEVKGFMGIDADAPDEELRRVAPDHPAFVISFDRD
jgi:deazaflavin-dependent oxidoreductase (nitroreductase family)